MCSFYKTRSVAETADVSKGEMKTWFPLGLRRHLGTVDWLCRT
jgi:hypothetical protein